MHAMSHPCGAVLNTHHGLTNAVVMPYVLVHNRQAIEERLPNLSRPNIWYDPTQPQLTVDIDRRRAADHVAVVAPH